MWEGLKVKDTGRLTLAFSQFVAVLSLCCCFKNLRLFFDYYSNARIALQEQKYDGGLQSFAWEMIARGWGWWRAPAQDSASASKKSSRKLG